MRDNVKTDSLKMQFVVTGIGVNEYFADAKERTESSWLERL